MVITMLKSKIHRAVVTGADINYVGSITIDRDLMDAAGLFAYEKVQIADINNGNRLETYVIEGPRGKGDICLNGAAAKLVEVSDCIIIMAYCQMDANEAAKHNPRIVFVDEKNRIIRTELREQHGMIG
ncbi:MAG: aspartate 1-decarboxylase [Christensenellales bacterium]